MEDGKPAVRDRKPAAVDGKPAAVEDGRPRGAGREVSGVAPAAWDRHERRDRGSGTVWGVAVMGLLLAVAGSFAIVGSVRVARHRVHSAADLSALAAARLVVVDASRACTVARSMARQNGADLVRCTVTGEVVDVWTSLSIEVPGIGQRTVEGRARAGPSRIDPGRPSSPPHVEPVRPAPPPVGAGRPTPSRAQEAALRSRPSAQT